MKKAHLEWAFSVGTEVAQHEKCANSEAQDVDEGWPKMVTVYSQQARDA